MDRGGTPHQGCVHSEVLMDHDVPHTGHVGPWDARMPLAHGARNALGRLADDGKVIKHGTNDHVMLGERCLVETGDRPFDPGAGFDDVTNARRRHAA